MRSFRSAELASTSGSDAGKSETTNKRSILTSSFQRKHADKLKTHSQSIEKAIPFLCLSLRRNESFFEEIRKTVFDFSLLTFLSSPASTFRVSWTDFDEKLDLIGVKFSSGKFKDTKLEDKSISSIEILKVTTHVDCSVHELMYFMMALNTTEFNHFFETIFGEMFLGGEVIANNLAGGSPNKRDSPLPVSTIKRASFDLGGSHVVLKDFLFADVLALEKDENLNQVGVYKFQSVQLSEIEPGVRNSQCQRCEFLDGTGIVARKPLDGSSSTELCLILRVDFGKEKSSSRKKYLGRLGTLVSGVKAFIDDAVNFQGSLSWKLGFSSEIILLDARKKESASVKGDKKRIEKLLGVQVETENMLLAQERSAKGEESEATATSETDEVDMEKTSSEETINLLSQTELCEVVKIEEDEVIARIRKNVQEKKRVQEASGSLPKAELESKSAKHSEIDLVYKKKYEQVVEQKLLLEAEMLKLRTCETETKVGNAAEEKSSFDLDDEMEKIKQELEKHKLENAQLRKKYEVIKAQTNNESLDKYNWDGELDSAEAIFLNLAKKVQEDPSDMVLLNDFERFEGIIRKHPEYKKREEARIVQWLSDTEPGNLSALEEMKTIVPANISTVSKNEISSRFETNPALGRRIHNNRSAFSIFYLDASEIQKIHIVDLKNKYDPKNFDLIELRAFFACLPKSFVADGDGSKAQWKESIRKKLEAMLKELAANTLAKSKQRDPVYSAPTKAKPAESQVIKTTNAPRPESSPHNHLLGALKMKMQLPQETLRKDDARNPLLDAINKRGQSGTSNPLLDAIKSGVPARSPTSVRSMLEEETKNLANGTKSDSKNINYELLSALRNNKEESGKQASSSATETTAMKHAPNLALLEKIRKEKRTEIEQTSFQKDVEERTRNNLVQIKFERSETIPALSQRKLSVDIDNDELVGKMLKELST